MCFVIIVLNYCYFRLDFQAAQGFGSITVIGKDTIIANEMSPGVVMDGLEAANRLYSMSRSRSTSSTVVKASSATESSATFKLSTASDSSGIVEPDIVRSDLFRSSDGDSIAMNPVSAIDSTTQNPSGIYPN